MAPGTLRNGAKCYRNTPKGKLCSNHLKTSKPTSAAKNAKKVKFEGASEEANVIKSHDEPTLRKKNRKGQNKKPNSYQSNADPSEDGRNYVLDCMNLGETVQESESDSE